MTRLLASLMLVLAFACKSAPPAKEQQSFDQWVAENLGGNILCSKNSNNIFSLCVKESEDSQAVTYFIVRMSDRSIVPWITRPLLYRGRCSESGGTNAAVFELDPKSYW